MGGPVTNPAGTVEEVVRVAEQATAHYGGTAVLATHRIGDRRWVLRMSSWLRCRDAMRGLRAAGYTVANCGPHGLDVSLCPRCNGRRRVYLRTDWERGAQYGPCPRCSS